MDQEIQSSVHCGRASGTIDAMLDTQQEAGARADTSGFQLPLLPHRVDDLEGKKRKDFQRGCSFSTAACFCNTHGVRRLVPGGLQAAESVVLCAGDRHNCLILIGGAPFYYCRVTFVFCVITIACEFSCSDYQ